LESSGKTKLKNDSKTKIDPDVIQWRIDQWFPDLSAEVIGKLKLFHEELLRANKAINLISVKTIQQADATHFADCILASRIISATTKIDEIYDFGSGNGFPGIIFSILFPGTKVHMVEIDQRKAEFLKHAVSTLQLRNADVMIRAVESLPEGTIKFAMSRGFASLSKSLLTTRRVFAKGGKYYHLKSEEWATEVAGIPTQLCSFWTPSLAGEYRLPVGEIKYSVVKTDKISD
jgi:16S rRNA (guanine527-N7)-methyltransferase